MRNHIGNRGESIFEVLVTKHMPGAGRLFYPTFLGDKYPVIDYQIDLLEHPFPAFFYASIKTTQQGYTANKGRLKVTILKKDREGLGRHIVPVYIFGIDENLEKGYMASANDPNSKLIINNISTFFPITENNLKLLHKEVSGYWENSRKKTKFVSSFK